MRCDGPESTDCLYLVNYLAQDQLLWLRAASGLSQSKNEDVDTGPQAMAGHAHWVAESRPECPNSLAFLSPAAACFAPRKSAC